MRGRLGVEEEGVRGSCIAQVGAAEGGGEGAAGCGGNPLPCGIRGLGCMCGGGREGGGIVGWVFRGVRGIFVVGMGLGGGVLGGEEVGCLSVLSLYFKCGLLWGERVLLCLWGVIEVGCVFV